MLGIKDVRDYVAGLGITQDRNVYCGKMPGKEEKTIGIYHLRNGPARPAIGGQKNSSYGIKPVSILVHWNRSVREAEAAADKLYQALLEARNATVNGKVMKFFNMIHSGPIDVEMDENNIYEMVIETEIYYDRRKEKTWQEETG